MSTQIRKSVEVVLPVFNEEKILESSVIQVVEYLRLQDLFSWRVVIADNASTDRTREVASQLSDRFHGEVYVHHLDKKGRGRALHEVWTSSMADVNAYMDIDLSTNLGHFVPMVLPLLAGEYHVATGSRLLKQSKVIRNLDREILSRSYNFVIKVFFPSRRFADAQCGFKAISREAASVLLPLVKDPSWFFDTELLLKAEHKGYRIFEIPVEWTEDLDSRVRIFSTVVEDIAGLVRVRSELFRTK